MRSCWNRQTGTFEGRVSTDVWVQVPSTAPSDEDSSFEGSFFIIMLCALNSKIDKESATSGGL